MPQLVITRDSKLYKEWVFPHADIMMIGGAPTNTLVLPDRSQKVSQYHAAIVRAPGPGECYFIRDLGSRNGTFVNGERIMGDRVVRAGDEIRLGKTRCSLRDQAQGPATLTETVQAPPDLTRREREVLLALCRPVFSEDVFTEPAATREIAAELFVTDAAVKQHLMHLYDKFGIHEEGERRRARLANEAIRRGAVTLADLKPPTGRE